MAHKAHAPFAPTAGWESGSAAPPVRSELVLHISASRAREVVLDLAKAQVAPSPGTVVVAADQQAPDRRGRRLAFRSLSSVVKSRQGDRR